MQNHKIRSHKRIVEIQTDFNEYVYFRLTPYGLDRYKKYYQNGYALLGIDPNKPPKKIEVEGDYYKMRLSKFINIFGNKSNLALQDNKFYIIIPKEEGTTL
jgi:hypothetical protein